MKKRSFSNTSNSSERKSESNVRKPDDCSLTASELARVRAQAKKLLQEADAFGTFPTPVEEIMGAAKVTEAEEDVLAPGLINSLRDGVQRIGAKVRSALSKVRGLFLSSERLIFIDKSLYLAKQQFIRLHETAHGFLPWQTPMYGLVEDSEEELDPDTADLFDREANVFASEVLFQLDTFSERVADLDFCIWTPVRQAKKFGASNYAAIRQYVSKNPRDCTVVVLNKPEFTEVGFEISLRRSVQSPAFTERFGNIVWPELFGPDDQIGQMVPLEGQRASGQRDFLMFDKNKETVVCRAEAFFTGHNVFVLICTQDTLFAPRLLRAG